MFYIKRGQLLAPKGGRMVSQKRLDEVHRRLSDRISYLYDDVSNLYLRVSLLEDKVGKTTPEKRAVVKKED